MMRKLLFISMFVGLSAFTATAQNQLTISEQSVERHGQNVKVTFKITAAEDAVRHGEKILVSSSIIAVDNGSHNDLDAFYVAGSQQQKIIRQKERLSRGSKPVTVIAEGETYTYVTTFDYSSMPSRNYELAVSAQKVGCCGVEQCMNEKYAYEVGPAMIPAVKEVAPHVTQVRELKPKYPFLRMVGTDAGSERGASVRFPVARIELKPDFLSNAKTLQDIEDAIRLVLDDEWAEIGKIEIAGYASPEGNTQQNQQLSVGRAEALKSYVMDKFGFSEDQFNVTAGGEDWSGLRALVAGSDMPYTEEILDIIDNVPQAQRQAKLKALAGGRPYKSMLDVLYPQLRDACYIRVWFSEKEDVVAMEVNAAVEDINTGRYAEALDRLMKYKDDARTWNAIGSVKVLTEDLNDARKWFSKAAKTGDSDAAKNLKQIEEIINNNN